MHRKMAGPGSAKEIGRPTHAGAGPRCPALSAAFSTLPPPMKRFASLLALLGAAAAAGCGGDKAVSPLDEGLSYLPKNAPFALAIDTNTSGEQYKSLGKILRRFPFGGQVRESLQRQLEENGRVSFQRDVKPLLGNQFVVGGVNPRSVTDGRQDDEFVGALQVKDKGKLESLVKKQGAKEDGDRGGAKLYRDKDGDPFAIKDDVLVVAGSRKLLEGALERRDGKDHLNLDAFGNALGDLPKDHLLTVYADLAGLIRSDPDTRDARRVKWVNALTTLGATAQARDEALNIEFKVNTRGGLKESDLPVASGDLAPGVVERAGDIGLGIRDPAQAVKFAEAAGQAVDPSGYGQYTAGKRRVQARYKTNLDRDVIEQLKGNTATTVSVDGKFATRAEVQDPAKMKRTLAKLAPALPQLLASGGNGGVKLAKPTKSQGFYELAGPRGQSVVFGVVGKALVVANDPTRARQVAAKSPTTVSDAKGAVVLKANAERVADRLLRTLGPRLGVGGLFGGRMLTAPLGELTGSLTSGLGGMSGKLTLKVD